MLTRCEYVSGRFFKALLDWGWILHNLYEVWKVTKKTRYAGTLTCITYYIKVHCSGSNIFFLCLCLQRQRRSVIILYPFCALFCYLLFAAQSNAYQRPDKNCQWFRCFTDNSSVFVQGDLTHQGSLLCFCCKALKRLCLCCKALKGEPLNPCKYSMVLLAFDFVVAVWKKTVCATLVKSTDAPFSSSWIRWIGFYQIQNSTLKYKLASGICQ